MNHGTEEWILSVLKTDVTSVSPSSISHPDLEMLFAYVLGELPPRETSLVKAHLLRCSECTRKLAAVDTASQSLVRESIGEVKSWSYASWHTRRLSSRAKKHRVRLFSAIASATASIGLLSAGLARMLLPTVSLAVPRGASSPIRWDLVGLLAAGGLAAFAAVFILIGRKR